MISENRLQSNNRLVQLENKVKDLSIKIDKQPIDKLVRKMDSEKDMQFTGGKFQKHIREYLDLDNKTLGKSQNPYSGVVLKDPDNVSWKVTVDVSGNLTTTEL